MGLAVIVLVFLVFDVMQTSVASTKGFKISQLQKDIVALEQDNRQLAVKIATYQSMQHIQSRLGNLKLEPVVEREFAVIADTIVVQR